MTSNTLLDTLRTLVYGDTKKIQLAKVFPKLRLHANCSNLQLEP